MTGQAAEEPDGHVEVVDVLLDDVIAGQFVEIEPVAGHVGGVRLTRIAALGPWHGAIPLHHAALDLTDRSGVDECFVPQIVGHVAALGAGHDGEALGLGLLAGGNHRAGSHGIHGHRFFDEAMFAGVDRSREMDGAEGGWRGHQHVVAISGDDFLVVVVTAEAFLRCEAVFFSDAFRLVLEGVAGGGHFGLDAEDFAGGEEIREGSVATSAAADEADFHFFGTCGGFKAKAELAASPMPARVEFPRNERRFMVGCIRVEIKIEESTITGVLPTTFLSPVNGTWEFS